MYSESDKTGQIKNGDRGGFSPQADRLRKIDYLLGCVRRRAPDYRAAFSARLHELSDAILQTLHDNALEEETRLALAREKRRQKGPLEIHPLFIERRRSASRDEETKKLVADRRKTQRDRVYYLLASYPGQWVPLERILALGAPQYGARIYELRRAGHAIENKIEHDEHGATHSWFRLLPPLKTA